MTKLVQYICICICVYTCVSCNHNYRDPVYIQGRHQHYIYCDHSLLQGRITDEPTACYSYRYTY